MKPLLTYEEELQAWKDRQGAVMAESGLPTKQGIIMAKVRTAGTITLDSAVSLVGRDIYANRKKHVGAILSRMVKAGLLTRTKPGNFAVAEGRPK